MLGCLTTILVIFCILSLIGSCIELLADELIWVIVIFAGTMMVLGHIKKK